MTESAGDEQGKTFFAACPDLADFADVANPRNFQPLPEGWLILTTDVVGSTEAVAAGRYKLVNMAGASAIAAVSNALGHRDFPFVFGGDGAAMAVPSMVEREVHDALAAVRTWVGEELDLELRAAITPIEDLRTRQVDVKVARFTPAPGVSYAMFDGGGIGLAEQQMKAGKYQVAPAPAGTRPDLTGLSCRWQPMDTRNGEVASVLVSAHPLNDRVNEYSRLIGEILQFADDGAGRYRPVPAEGPRLAWPPNGLRWEAAASAFGKARIPRVAGILTEQLLGWFSDRSGLSLGSFNARRYRREVAANSDFRKFDDGLKLTLDLTNEKIAELSAHLDAAERSRICLYGLHRQSQALMTCIVPSVTASDHIHFVDGAGGGYVEAARMLKAKLARLTPPARG